MYDTNEFYIDKQHGFKRRIKFVEQNFNSMMVSRIFYQNSYFCVCL